MRQPSIGTEPFKDIEYRHWLIGQALSAGHSSDEAVRRADAVIEQLDKEQEPKQEPSCEHSYGLASNFDETREWVCSKCGHRQKWKP